MNNVNREFSPLGVDLFGEVVRPQVSGVVADKFIVPPFSILDAKQGEWQRRKRAWVSIGLESETGREAKCNAATLRPLTGDRDRMVDKGTSVFDPVLCELAYSWFSCKGSQIVDPFAGGSVRGVVASALGRKYWGGELRGEQVEANRQQGRDLCPDDKNLQWVEGDSLKTLDDAPESDFVFSCPPYGNLEVYSDDPNDISNMEYHTFKAAYSHIILKAVSRLKQDRFACFVVGDFRDKKGFYRNFVSDTIQAFENAGAKLYNEMILATPLGNAAMRANHFAAGRKCVKVHQNVLVFCKGDWRKATKAAKGEL
jgi:hypothetical protein